MGTKCGCVRACPFHPGSFHTHIHTQIHTHTHTHTHTLWDTHVHSPLTHTHAHTHTEGHTRAQPLDAHTHPHTHTHTHTLTVTGGDTTHLCAHTQRQVSTNITLIPDIHAQTHTHTHAPSCDMLNWTFRRRNHTAAIFIGTLRITNTRNRHVRARTVEQCFSCVCGTGAVRRGGVQLVQRPRSGTSCLCAMRCTHMGNTVCVPTHRNPRCYPQHPRRGIQPCCGQIRRGGPDTRTQGPHTHTHTHTHTHNAWSNSDTTFHS